MIMSKIPKQKRLVQEVEEKDEVRKERELLLEKLEELQDELRREKRSRKETPKESSFFDNIINLADAITDTIPVVSTVKKYLKVDGKLSRLFLVCSKNRI